MYVQEALTETPPNLSLKTRRFPDSATPNSLRPRWQQRGQTDGTDTRKIEVRYRTAYWDVRPAGLTLCYKDAAQLARGSRTPGLSSTVLYV